MTVNDLHESDLSAVAALDRRLFSAESWSEADLRASLSSPDRRFFTLWDGEILAGFCGLQWAGGQGDILTVGIDPAYRRRGLGKELMQTMIRCFAAEGGGALFLEVRRSNAPAVALYESLGFSMIRVIKNYYRQPAEDGLVYSLEVTT